MRVLVVHPGPDFSVADVFNGVVKGLKEHGCEVGTFNFNDRLTFYNNAFIRDGEGGFKKALDGADPYDLAAQGIEVACYEFWPDVVIIMSGWFIPPKIWGVLAKRPHHVVFWCTESPYEDDYQGQAARYADTVILNDPANIGQYLKEINERTYYLPHSYDPDVHYPGVPDPELECDFAFTGTGFPSRIEFFEQVDWSGIDVRLGGNWKHLDDGSRLHDFLVHDIDQSMDNTVTADLYRSAKIGANLYRKEHSKGGSSQGWAMGPREVEMAACGLFFLREPRREGDEVLEMLPTFETPDEFTDLVRYYLKHDDERLDLVKEAAAAVRHRTFYHTTAELLSIIQSHPAPQTHTVGDGRYSKGAK